MSENNTPLSKVEVLWAEIIKLANQLDLTTEKIVEAETSVGNTVTSLEESLATLHSKMKELSDSADGVLNEKEVELRRKIELALSEAEANHSKRDLEVVEMISESIDQRIGVLQKSVEKQLQDSVIQTSAHIQSESNKHLVRATQSIERANKADKAVFVSLAVILVLMFSGICSYAAWHAAYLHFANSSKEADRFITTQDGKASIAFAKLNNIQKMLDCDGYKKTKQGSNTYCVPMDGNKNVSGWRID